MELVSTPTINPHAADYLKAKIDGKSMRALALKRIATIQKLKANKEARAATILNFNPVPLRLEGGIPFKVPSMIDQGQPDEFLMRVEYGGREYKAAILTVRDPLLYFPITDVTRTPEQDVADGVGVYDVAICKQIEIAHDFYQAYNEGAPDSSNMGGVVIFEGDKHALKADQIQVPTFVNLVTGEREYFCEPKNFSDVVAHSLQKQKRYYELQVQTAQNYWNDPDLRKNITPVHLIWAQYGLDQGWREKAVDWQLSTDSNNELCGGCGATRKSLTAHFCQSCSRAYDPLRSYLEGELPIDSVQMERVPDEQWHLVEAEEAHRVARKQRRRRPVVAAAEDATASPAPADKPKGKGHKEPDKADLE